MIIQLYRSAYSGLSRSVWLLAAVMFINRCGTMVIPFLGVYLTESLHLSIDKSGVVMALFGVGSIVGTLVGGRLTDRLGAYNVMWMSLGLGGLMFIVVGQLQSFEALCLGTFVLGSVAEAFRPAVTASVALYSRPENRTRSYSLNRLALNLGWSVGPAVGGWLASVNYSLLFWVDGCTCIAAAILLRLILPKTSRSSEEVTEQSSPTDSAYRDYKYLVFMIFVTLFAISFFQLFSTVPLYYKQVYHLPEDQIGTLMALNGILIVCIEMVLVHKLENRYPSLHLMAMGSILVACSYFIFNVTFGVWWLVIAMITATFAEMLAMPFMNTYALQRAKPHNRGQYTAIYTASWSIAQISAPLIGTQFISRMGFTMVWWLMVTFCVMAACGFWAIYYKTGRIEKLS
ncbi:MFS transporter [Siphonobacter sp. SORGH_AS_0500]|uniref:MDR family MFS transporter n=1 Tax=Siphonobacter sp. SORGH_AS_0500 TaxID=1864824 RepID=UPI002858DA29|nr:MFS transporter [Siphonobacter sp. SORGH_AS_0500]MDR6197004.1 putative MFS family arabinose efflux permease [Siphonobacter sp. SORGH_AS_0500]